jgi:flagellum-specific peptidoglycan hydrolase FlgJ
VVIQFVPKQRFSIANRQIVDLFANEYEAVVGGEAPPNALSALCAQARLETGGAPWCWNFGNIRGVGPEGLWTTFAAGEIIDGIEVTLPPGSANKFRAYRTAESGARDYLALLCLGKFAPAIAIAATGDVAGFVHELHRLGYFTASEGAYGHGIMSVEATLAKLPQMAAYFKDVHL